MSKESRPVLLGLLACVLVIASAQASAGDQPHPSPEVRSPSFPVEHYALRNGLEVALQPDHRSPLIAINIWYHVGSRNDPTGRSGFAHLFEHLMLQGSRHVGDDMFYKYLEEAGVSDRNATTGFDRTNYFETLPANQLELALWLESDRMGFLDDKLTEDTFRRTRDVVQNERRQRVDDTPYGLVESLVRDAVFPSPDPYNRSIVGDIAQLEASTLAEARAFHQKWYGPNNASLSLVGDFDSTRAKALIEKYFGSLPASASPSAPLSTPTVAPLAAPSTLNIESGVELGRIVLAWRTPGKYRPGDAELELLSRVLAGGVSSPLHRQLVHDLGLAQSIWCYQDTLSWQLARIFTIDITLRKGASARDALKLINAELQRLRAVGPESAELVRARLSVVNDRLFDDESFTRRADLLGDFMQMVKAPNYFESDLTRFANVRPEDLRQAASKWLSDSARVTAIVTARQGAPLAGALVREAAGHAR